MSELSTGEWVNVTGEDEPWVLAEVGIDIEATVTRLNEDDQIREWGVEFGLDDDVPYDLLWNGHDRRKIVPRTTWRQRVTAIRTESDND